MARQSAQQFQQPVGLLDLLPTLNGLLRITPGTTVPRQGFKCGDYAKS